MHHLGNFSLMAILVLAAYAIIASLLGVKRGSVKLTTSAERALLACTAFSTAACFSLVWLVMKSDFRFEYVASYSNRDLPFFYKLASLWAGNDGSLLFWSWLMLLFSGIAVITNRNKNRELMPYVVATLAGVALFFIDGNYFVTQHIGQLVLAVGQNQQPARHEDMSTGQCKSVRRLLIDDLEFVAEPTPRRVAGESLADFGYVGNELRIFDQPQLPFHCKRGVFADLPIHVFGFENDLSGFLPRRRPTAGSNA